MRVLQIIEATNAGVARHVFDLCEELLPLGIEIDLAYSRLRMDSSNLARLQALEGSKGFRSFACDMRRGPHPSDWKAIRTILGHMKTHGAPDLIHGHSTKGGAIGRMVGFMKRRPVIYTPNAVRSMDPQLHRMARYLIDRIEGTLSLFTKHTIAVSPEEQEHLEKRVGVRAARITVVPNGTAAYELPTRMEARKSLGLPEDKAIVGFVGRLDWQKGPDILVEAITEVIKKNPEVLFAIIGDGEMGDSLKKRAQELGIESQVRWLGFQDGPRSMPAFDLFVLPSRYEGLPYVLLEALFTGLAIIASDQTGQRLLIDDGVNGYVYPFQSHQLLAQNISLAVADREKLVAMGTASKQKSTQFGRDRMAQRTLDVYRKVLES